MKGVNVDQYIWVGEGKIFQFWLAILLPLIFKASNPANSSSVKLVEPQLKKSLSFNPKSPGDNSTFFNDQQPLQKSLSFKPPKTINSESNDVKMRNILTDWCMTIPNRSC
uniref:Uncharacterized protein n=1 Tax=Globodera pallida TaxID=36090 RepID=A0A183BW67_GLOPA